MRGRILNILAHIAIFAIMGGIGAVLAGWRPF